MEYIKIRFVEDPEGAESEFHRTLDEMIRGADHRFMLFRHRWRPQTDIYETAGEIVIRAEIAGLRQEEIQLEISSGVVKISGTRTGGPCEQDARYRLAEIPCGYFERILTLPVPVDTDSAAAHYQDGLLEIRLVKRSLNRIQRISIRKG
jgi:HSP20 family protein